MNVSNNFPKFVAGPPVKPNDFLNRDYELLTVFERLYSGQSSAIIGEPHIGKSSFLLKISDKQTQKKYLGEDAGCFIFSYISMHTVNDDYVPRTFWERALKSLQDKPGSAAIASRIGYAAKVQYDSYALNDLFELLSKKGRKLILLLDEIEMLLFHKNFDDFAFFATLRHLDSISGGFNFITTSRLSLAKQNERGFQLRNSNKSSPLFNTQIEIRLKPFDNKTIDLLLDRAGVSFSTTDKQFIRGVAGRHPFLLQALSSVLLKIDDKDRYEKAAERFYEEISSHFDDVWGGLDDRTRTVSVVLSLIDTGGSVLGNSYAIGEIQKVDAFGPELRRLAERGLAERVETGWIFDTKNLLLWRGEKWAIGTKAFSWWVRDVVIDGTRKVATVDEWLSKKRYTFLSRSRKVL